MHYIKDNTRHTLYQIRKAHPNVSIPEGADLSSLGYAPLEETPQPDPIAEHRVIPGPDEEYAPGQWRQTWVQEPIPEPPVPESATALQALLAIDELGYSTQYETWANDPARTFREKAFINKAEYWKIGDPQFNAAADDLGFTEEDKADFFRLASTL